MSVCTNMPSAVSGAADSKIAPVDPALVDSKAGSKSLDSKTTGPKRAPEPAPPKFLSEVVAAVYSGGVAGLFANESDAISATAAYPEFDFIYFKSGRLNKQLPANSVYVVEYNAPGAIAIITNEEKTCRLFLEKLRSVGLTQEDEPKFLLRPVSGLFVNVKKSLDAVVAGSRDYTRTLSGESAAPNYSSSESDTFSILDCIVELSPATGGTGATSLSAAASNAPSTLIGV